MTLWQPLRESCVRRKADSSFKASASPPHFTLSPVACLHYVQQLPLATRKEGTYLPHNDRYSSVGMGVPVVVTAAQAEDPRDPAVLAPSLPSDIVLSLTSETVGVPAVIKAAAGDTSLPTDAVLSL